MTKLLTLLTALVMLSALAVTPTVAAEPAKDDKEKLKALLTSLKVKATTVKEKKSGDEIQVASAGARGSQSKSGSRLSPSWPETGVSPLSALTRNIEASLAKGESWSVPHKQVVEFVDGYPEYKDEPKLRELLELLVKHSK